jgi:hypothetical protein
MPLCGCLALRILLAIVHHWNPQGNGRHQSLRPDPQPRLYALQDQLLCLRRLGVFQGTLNIAALEVQPVNQATAHVIDIMVVTDGRHRVLDLLEESYRPLLHEEVVQLDDPMHLGFEAQRLLAERLDQHYDLYGYIEDDLLISDPFFFRKIDWFRRQFDDKAVLLPHRVELHRLPDAIDKLYVDGPVDAQWLLQYVPQPPVPVQVASPAGDLVFVAPENPHAGCFFLSHRQLQNWSVQPWFLDGDCSYVSPLESAATLGLLKTFQVYKPALSHANWLELQHWGQSFRSLVGRQVAPMRSQ